MHTKIEHQTKSLVTLRVRHQTNLHTKIVMSTSVLTIQKQKIIRQCIYEGLIK